jgi:hypothetical protein
VRWIVTAWQLLKDVDLADNQRRSSRWEWVYAILVIACVTGLAYLPLITQLGLYRATGT